MNNMKLTNIPPTGLALIFAIIVSACAPGNVMDIKSSKKTEPNNVSCIDRGGWLNPKTNAYVPTNKIIKNAARHRVVLLGETHTNFDHHLWQLQTIAQIHGHNPNMILGFEAFSTDVQDVLDNWVAGNLSKKDFLTQSKWNEFWRFDSNLYMPIFNFARINNVPMVALNINRSLIKKVSSGGWESVKKADRHGITNPATPSAGYMKILKDVYEQHDKEKDKHGKEIKNQNSDDFDRFVDVQLTWDRAFAQNIASSLNENSGSVMVNIIGRGHIDYGFGVQSQLSSLGVSDVIALSPWDSFEDCAQLNIENNAIAIADAVFAIAKSLHIEKTNKPKLGVFIEQGEGGVLVKDIVKESVGESAGIKTGDLIIKAAGFNLQSPGELIAIINSIAPGTWLPLVVLRDGKKIEIVARF